MMGAPVLEESARRTSPVRVHMTAAEAAAIRDAAAAEKIRNPIGVVPDVPVKVWKHPADIASRGMKIDQQLAKARELARKLRDASPGAMGGWSDEETDLLAELCEVLDVGKDGD